MPAKKKAARKPVKHASGKGPRPFRRADWETPEQLVLIQGWARDGLTQEEIAHNMGIVPQTLSKWKGESEEIREALKQGREVVNRLVENALIKRALGFEYTEVTDELSADDKKHKTVRKYVAPDVGAAIFILCNRMGDVWKQRRQDDDASDAALKKLDDVLAKIDTDVNAAADEAIKAEAENPDKGGGE